MVFGGAVKWWESYRLLDCRQAVQRGCKNALAKARHHRSGVHLFDPPSEVGLAPIALLACRTSLDSLVGLQSPCVPVLLVRRGCNRTRREHRAYR